MKKKKKLDLIVSSDFVYAERERNSILTPVTNRIFQLNFRASCTANSLFQSNNTADKENETDLTLSCMANESTSCKADNVTCSSETYATDEDLLVSNQINFIGTNH